MEEKKELARSLHSGQIQMIAIGGAIGTGLFLGSGTAIHQAGPAILLAYLITGIFCFFLMRAIGELLLSNTKLHSFIDFVKEYLGNRLEFVIGWTYWFCWLMIAMADLTATGIYVKFWFPNFPQWATPLIIIILLQLANLVDVGLFGAMESWFAFIKVAAIIALIIIGIGVILMGVKVKGETASLTNLVSHGGFFPTGLKGFAISFQMVVFSFVGIEMVGLTAGETRDPEKNLPKAINTLPIRIGLFYIGSMLVIMSIYAWNKISTTSSPFVQVLSDIGIPGAAGIMNFVVLTAAMSACNSAIFSTSRTLFALAVGGNAPKRFKKLNNNAVPSKALNFSTLILVFVVVLNFLMPSSVFVLISGVATVSFIFIWSLLVWSHVKYRQQNPNGVAAFKMPMYPLSDYLTLAFFAFIAVVLIFDPNTRVSLFISIVWFVGLFIGSLFMNKKKALEED